jgi:trk system potassium uptake protein
VKVIIVGCGRVGATMAEQFDTSGHQVTVLDISTAAFDRLPTTFKGNTVRADGTDEDTLRRVGASDADIFLALTEGDNRNVMAAQIAAEALGARRVLAKINDPVRAAAYSELGVASLCRTALMADAINGYLGLPLSGMPGVIPPSRRHAEEHNEPAPLGPAPAGAIPVSVNTVPTGQDASVSNGEV